MLCQPCTCFDLELVHSHEKSTDCVQSTAHALTVDVKVMHSILRAQFLCRAQHMFMGINFVNPEVAATHSICFCFDALKHACHKDLSVCLYSGHAPYSTLAPILLRLRKLTCQESSLRKCWRCVTIASSRRTGTTMELQTFYYVPFERHKTRSHLGSGIAM